MILELGFNDENEKRDRRVTKAGNKVDSKVATVDTTNEQAENTEKEDTHEEETESEAEEKSKEDCKQRYQRIKSRIHTSSNNMTDVGDETKTLCLFQCEDLLNEQCKMLYLTTQKQNGNEDK